MKLQDIAKQELAKLYPDGMSPVALRNVGWNRGEWCCAKCGTMIGKNLKGESPFVLVHIHSNDCGM